MRFSPRAWPMSSSAFRRGDSTPRCSKKPVVRLMISSTLSISVVVGSPRPHGQRPAGQRRQLFLEIRALQRLDDRVELALHDGGQAVEREADAVVGHAVLGEIVSADALTAPAGADLAAAL